LIVDPASLPAFTAAVLVIVFAPGPDMMFMIGTGLNAGRRGAVVAAFGVTAGVSVYVIGSALGLAALVEQVPEVLDVIRVLGAAYLSYLGVVTWRNAGSVASIDQDGPRAISEVFRRGFIVNITNPKVALFIAAFIPRFVDPSRGNTTAQFLTYALTFQAIGLMVDLVVGFGAGSCRHFLMQRPTAARNLDRLAAMVYLAIATWLAIDLAT